MGWRVVVIESECRISYKNGFILLKKIDDVSVHISEIDVLIISTTQISFTGVALNELTKNKVKIIFCDEKHNPLGEFVSYYGCYNSPKCIQKQIAWADDVKGAVFSCIIKQKILNQSKVLEKYGFEDECKLLQKYYTEVQCNDLTNREGHAAKVYFNAIFGSGFVRHTETCINAALNYGYTILLSYINREIVSNGRLTQLGLKHCSEYNEFNLSCDFIEPFRVLIDDFVIANPPTNVDQQYKRKIIEILAKKVVFCEKEMYFSNVVSACVKSILNALDLGKVDELKLYEF